MRNTIVGRALIAGAVAGALLLTSAGACGPAPQPPETGTVAPEGGDEDDADDGDDGGGQDRDDQDD